ncbi:MAG: LysM peptidoglycan-binding domain-containing protein, partial [Halanaerobiales bacterium]
MKNKLLYFFLSFLMAILFLNPIVEAESKRLVIDLSGKDTNQINASQYINYTIQPGDTLYKLALQYGT